MSKFDVSGTGNKKFERSVPPSVGAGHATGNFGGADISDDSDDASPQIVDQPNELRRSIIQNNVVKSKATQKVDSTPSKDLSKI